MLDNLLYAFLSPLVAFLRTTLGSTLLFWAPTLIALYRKLTGKPILLPFYLIAMCNLTIVGWPLALTNAFNLNPVGWTMRRLGFVPGGSPVAPAPVGPRAGSLPGSPQVVPCGQCQATGQMTCSTCSGRGSWYDQPQGATGSAQLRSCPACMSSGRVRCASCGGSGNHIL
jgi:hypothetical protein